MRGDNPILTTNPNTLFLIFVISYAVFFKPIQYTSISSGDRNEGSQPYTNYKSQHLALYIIISYPTFFKPIQ